MSETEPLISVIIPIYNMESYLEHCLDSVLNNTYRNLEVICIDDGSKDHSLEIVRRYEAADPRIAVITKENGGVSSARNAGLDRMTGKFVTFVDPDDFIHPQYFEILLFALQETNTSISFCCLQPVGKDEDIRPETWCMQSDIVQEVSFSQIVRNQQLRSYCGGRMILSELTAGVRFSKDLQYGEDTVFFAEVCGNEQKGKASFVCCPLYYYYQRDESLTAEASIEQKMRYISAIVQKSLLTQNQDTVRDTVFLNHAIRVGLPFRYKYMYNAPSRKTARECTRLLNLLQGKIWSTRIYSLKEKIAYSSFIRFPRLYRLHRVLGEPSILKWERIERRNRKHAE